ncbi:MAG TPA: DUF1572 family protein [Bryobacteraceae bacterium]|nr:DUF1572 family protein [Bryobacteraceae bacterium]
MPDTLHQEFLHCSIERLRQSRARIEGCLGKLNADQIWARGSENENAIGNLVLHLCGNVRQWIIAGVGGSPDVRKRDEEFAARGGASVSELLAKLHATVDEACTVLERVSQQRLLEPLVIQQYAVTGMGAIYHVVEHFSGHTGQVIFATKMLTGEDLGFYRHLSAKAAHSQKTPQC